MADSTPKPWSIRGISEETRQTAIEAASRAGLDLGPWVSHAIRQTAQSDRGGLAGEVVSDRVTDRAPDQVSHTPSDSLAIVATLFAGLGQVADKDGCGGVARRARALLDQHMDALALVPLPARQARPRIGQGGAARAAALTPPSSVAAAG